MRATLLAVAFIVTSSCGGTTTPEPVAETPATHNQVAAAVAVRPTQVASEGTRAPAQNLRIRYAFAEHIERAELRHVDAANVSVQLADGGSVGFQKYTLGGWRSRFGRSAMDAETSVAVMEGLTGFLHLPLDSAEDLTITMRARARAPRDGRITVYVAERTVANVQASTGDYSVVQFRIPAEHLHAGENLIQLRVAGTGPFGSVSNAGLLVDWIAWGRRGVDTAEFATSTEANNAHTLQLREGQRLSYTFELEPGMHLLASIAGAGTLAVVRQQDGQHDVEIANL